MERRFEKIFFQWSPLWSYGNPLNFFSTNFEKFFYASNCFKTIKNVFFHQNNHFELIERRFKKIFFQWSPLWSYGHPFNFFSTNFEKFFYASNCFKTIKNVFFHQNNHFELIERRFEKIFFQWSPLWSYGHPLNFFSTKFEIFFYPSYCFKTIKNVFFHQNNHFELIERRFVKIFFQWSPLWSYGHPLNFFSTNFEIFFNASNCFKTIKNVFFHQNNHFELIERRFEKIFFQWSPLWSYGNPLNFFSTNFEIFFLCFKLL